MKIKVLIKKLKEIEKDNPNAEVFLTDEKGEHPNIGISTDDMNDVEIYIMAD